MLFWWIFRDCLMWVRSGGRYALPLCGICSLCNIRIFTIIFVYYWNHFDSKKESNKKKIHKNARHNQKLKSVRFDFYSPPQRTHNIIEMLQLYIVRLRCLIKRRFNWTGAKNSIFFHSRFDWRPLENDDDWLTYLYGEFGTACTMTTCHATDRSCTKTNIPENYSFEGKRVIISWNSRYSRRISIFIKIDMAKLININ